MSTREHASSATLAQDNDDNTLPRLLHVVQLLSEKRDINSLLAALLEEACFLCGACQGWVWLQAEEGRNTGLRCLAFTQDSQSPRDNETHNGHVDEAAHLYRTPDTQGLVEQCLQSGEPLTVDIANHPLTQDDAHVLEGLTPAANAVQLWPLYNHEGRVTGVMQLAYQHGEPGNLQRFEHGHLIFQSLLTYGGIALSNLSQVQDLKDLLDAFVRVIARAIDAKSPHTSAHCQRVPVITEMLAQAACDDTGTFADFALDADGWYELRVAAWLHDCGKLATPNSVLDKSTKLHTLHDRISEIASRFAVLRQHALLTCERACMAEPNNAQQLRESCEQELQQLENDLAFLEQINRGGETMAQEDQARVHALAARTWQDARGQSQPLLTADEVANLCIVRGTLTAEERRVINGHMDVTLDMLGSLPFPAKLRNVPEYAGGHHEKMDGTGFPLGLTREQMSIPARIMAIADVFEALTAKERPYKPPMKLSEALGIMQRMRDNAHLDPDLYPLFVRSGVWKTYAQQYLDAAQLDVDDATQFL